MISTHYICNGCGLYTSYKGKNEKQLNEIEVDLSNYLVFTSAFIMKEPIVKIHFCDECYSKVLEGEIKVKSFGDRETMRTRISELVKEVSKAKRELEEYKNNIKRLLSWANANKFQSQHY